MGSFLPHWTKASPLEKQILLMDLGEQRGSEARNSGVSVHCTHTSPHSCARRETRG